MNVDVETRAAIDDLCREVVAGERIPGLSVAVTDARETVYATGYGSRDLAGNRPATGRTLYGVGSCTKSMTALALGQISEAGMLSFDDPVADHLDAEADLGAVLRHGGAGKGDAGAGESEGGDGDGSAGGEGEPVRIRHLLSHTSGIPSLGTSETLIGRRLRRSVDTLPLSDREDFYAHIRGAVDERTGPPGERFAYNNAGYVLLGDVIENATGRSFAEYVTEHVFEPLGMDRTTFDDFAFSTDDDHATPYLLEEEEEPTAASLPVRELGHPAGGALASVVDLARYLRLFLGDDAGAVGGAGGAGGTGGVDGGAGPGADPNAGTGAGSAERRRLVDPSTVSELLEPRAETPRGPYAAGWLHESVGGRTVVGHAGDVAVSSAYVGFCEAADVGVAVAANTAPPFSLGRVGQGVLAAALGDDPYSTVPFLRRRALFSAVVGEYAAYRGVKRATVRRDGGSVRVDFDGPLGGESVPLIPADEAGRSWREAGEARFEAVGGGGERRPARFLDDDGPELLFDRWRLHRIGPPTPEKRSVDGRRRR
jgi:CubicO group peptidase (beta-lactamase class C family)